MNFYEIAQARYSCRKFNPEKPIEEEKISAILNSAVLAPSACNGQSYHITVCGGDSAKKVATATQEKGMNKFTSDAPVMMVISEEPPCKGALLGMKYKGLDYRPMDIGILSAYITCEAAAKELDSCIIGWFNEDEIKEICGVEGAIRLIIALGYAADEAKAPQKVRKDISEIVSFMG